MFYELQPGQSLVGQVDRYTVVRTRRAGTQGVTFLAVRESDGSHVTLKTPAIELDSGLSTADIRKKLGEIHATFEADFEALQQLSDVDGVAHVFDYGTTRAEIGSDPFFLLFIVYRYIRGPQLDEFLAARYGRIGAFRGVPTAKVFFDMGLDLASRMRAVHRYVVHGDVWPSNILVEDERLILVDFGQATLRDNAIARPNPGRDATYPYVAPEGSGTIAAEVYSLGAVLFYIATGEAPPLPDGPHGEHQENVRLRRRTIVRLIESKNPMLHAGNLGVAEVIAWCLLASPLDRPKSVESVIEALEVFSADRHIPMDDIQVMSLDVGSPIFRRMLEYEVRQLQRIRADMRQGMYDLIGDHDDVMAGLTAYLSQVGADDAADELLYLTITTASFWLQDAVQVGQFLAMNMELSRRGAVRRIFLLTKEEMDDPRLREVLREHADAMRNFAVLTESRFGPRPEDDLVAPGYWCGVVVMDGDSIEAAVNECHVGLLRRDGVWTTVVPVYGDDRTTAGLQFRSGWRATREADLALERYRELAKVAAPLADIFPEEGALDE